MSTTGVHVEDLAMITLDKKSRSVLPVMVGGRGTASRAWCGHL